MNSNNEAMARLIVEKALPSELSLSRLANENATLYLEELQWGSARLLLWVEMELQDIGMRGKDFVLACRLRAKDMSNHNAEPVILEMDFGIAKQAIERNESPIRACLAASPDALEKIRKAIPSVNVACDQVQMDVVSEMGVRKGTRPGV